MARTNSTALVPATNTRQAVSINLANINHALAMKSMKKNRSAIGGGEAREAQFPGKQISFKNGIWTAGYGNDAKNLKAGTKLIVNVPNAIAGWSSWHDSSGGKRYPKYEHLIHLALGEEMKEREELGQLDEEEWDTDQAGRPQDPFKAVLVFPCRFENDDTVHHIMLTAKSHVGVGFDLYEEVMGDLKMHDGELPVVVIGADKAKMEKKEVDKRGKEKKTQYVWDVPTLEVAGWTDAVDADNPPKGGVTVKSNNDDDADIGEVETVARKAPAKPSPAKKAAALPAPAKKSAAKPVPPTKKRKSVEIDDGDM